MPSQRLLLHESIAANGEVESSWLEVADGELALGADGQPATPLPETALSAVMRRYGRPLADDAGQGSGGELGLASGARVFRLRHLARYDVIAKDYLVYEPPGEEALAELATSVSAALWFIARRLHQSG